MSIVRRIKREARNNPAKAAVLVGLLVVALYFWAPLIAGWFGGKESSPMASIPEDPGRPDRLETAPPASASETTKEQPSWDELQQWRQQSPWTVPVELAQRRDPFCLVAASEEPVGDSDEPAALPQSTPEQIVGGLELQLTGTIVGPGRRVAVLGGRAYREGDVVVVEHLGTTWELEVRRIEANRVKLGWQSIEREVAVPEPKQVGRIEVVNHSG